MVMVAQEVMPNSESDTNAGCVHTRHLAKCLALLPLLSHLTLMKPLLPSPFFFKKIYLAAPGLIAACGVWFPDQGLEPRPRALRVQSLLH